jgi:hypothetical protein
MVSDPAERTSVNYLLQMPVDAEDGETLVFEVSSEQITDDLVLSADPEKSVVRAQLSLSQAINKVEPGLKSLVRLLRRLSAEEVEIEFGLKIGGETGIIISKGMAEVNFSVRMTWAKEREAPSRQLPAGTGNLRASSPEMPGEVTH